MEPLTTRRTGLPTLAGYFVLLRSGWIQILVSTVVCTALSLWLQSQVPRPYQASVSVELPAVASDVQLDPAASSPKRATIDSTAQLVFSTPVVRRVAAVTKQSPLSVRDGLSVSAYPLSNVLIIGYQAPTEQVARRGAEAAARATLAERTTVFAGAQLASARTLYAQLQHLHSRSVAKAQAFPRVTRRIDFALQHLRKVLSARVGEAGARIDTAHAAEKLGAQPALYPTTGFVTGFMAGVGWVWWRRPVSG